MRSAGDDATRFTLDGRPAGQGAMLFAIGPFGNRTAAEAETRLPRIAIRPTAGPWGERADRLGGARQGGLLRRRRDEEGDGRLGLSGAVGSSGNRSGGLLDLNDCDCFHGQEAKQKKDPIGDVTITRLPSADAARADAEQLGDAVLRDAERAECGAKFGRGCWRVPCSHGSDHNARVAANHRLPTGAVIGA